MTMPDALRLSAEEVHARIVQGKPVIIVDVRTEDALSVHPYQIPGSRWLPLAAVVEQVHTLPRQSTIVCY
jgi:rhodanese-related sulfurtransferase